MSLSMSINQVHDFSNFGQGAGLKLVFPFDFFEPVFQSVKVYLVIMTNGTGAGRLGISPGITNGPEVARVHAEEARCSSRELGD